MQKKNYSAHAQCTSFSFYFYWRFYLLHFPLQNYRGSFSHLGLTSRECVCRLVQVSIYVHAWTHTYTHMGRKGIFTAQQRCHGPGVNSTRPCWCGHCHHHGGGSQPLSSPFALAWAGHVRAQPTWFGGTDKPLRERCLGRRWHYSEPRDLVWRCEQEAKSQGEMFKQNLDLSDCHWKARTVLSRLSESRADVGSVFRSIPSLVLPFTRWVFWRQCLPEAQGSWSIMLNKRERML